MTKLERKSLEADIKYLMKVSKCTRTQAVLALIKNGKIQGCFSDTAIANLLGLGHSQTLSAIKSAEHKLRTVVRMLPELLSYTKDVDSKNYQM